MNIRYTVMPLIVLCGILILASCGKNTSNSNSLLALLQGTAPVTPGAATIVQGDRKFILSWAPVAGATSYEIWFYSDNDSTSAWRSGGDITGTTHVITGLTTGTAYFVWLKAKNKAGASDFGPVASKTVIATGTKTAFTADSITFNMVFVPGGFSFKTGTDDLGTATVDNPYWIGENEVTYELWYNVYHWAVTDTGSGTREDGGTLYSFANSGREGGNGTIGKEPMTAELEPATTISWRDCMIWCNAFTEWYNRRNGTYYTCVYYIDSAYTSPIRAVDNDDSYFLNPGEQDNPYVRTDANGFRLPTSMEWELAARYADSSEYGMYEYPSVSGNWWAPGNYSSGALAAYTDWTATDAVAWFGNSTVAGTGNTINVKPVMGKLPNSFGIYDMSGNVWEWCFDWHPTNLYVCRMRRGGSFYASNVNLQVGYSSMSVPNAAYNAYGFRIVMSSL